MARDSFRKRDVIRRVADHTGLPRADVEKVLHQVLEEMIAELSKGRRIEFRDFGSFQVRQRAARPAQNPRTGEPMTIAARRTVRFKPGQRLRDAVSGTRRAARKALHKTDGKPKGEIRVLAKPRSRSTARP